MPRNREKTLGGHFTIQIHHGGKFFNRPTIRYEGGCVESCEKCDPDVMSLITIGDIVGALGYTGMINYYYVMTGKNINNGLKMLLTDSDIIDMIEQLPPSRIVDMYVEPIIPIEMMESQTDEGGPTPTPTPTDKGNPTETQKGCTTDEGCPTKTDKGSRNEKDCQTETDKGGPTDKGEPCHEVNYENFLVDDAFFEDGFCDGTTYDGVHVQDLGDRTSESDMSFEVDSDYEQSDDDGLYEANVDEDAEWAGFDNSKGKEPNLNDDIDDDDDDKDYGDDSSDDLHSACSNSDDDRKKDKFHEYRRETDLGKVQFTVGMKFPSAKEFREAVREYSIKEGKDIKFVKNETTRVKAKCDTEGCGWSVMASLSQKGESFQVKTHKSEHDCLRSFKVRHVTSKYLAEKYVDSIRSNPDMPLDHLQQRVKKDLVRFTQGDGVEENNYGQQLELQQSQNFKKHMDLMRTTDVEAYKWLAEKPASQWSSCRRWDLKGIPCVHAIVAITFKRENILDYCHPCYGKETNANIYRGIIYPINGWTMWPSSGCVPVLPPNYGRSAGRPKKSRRKDREELEIPDADKLKRQNTSLRCGKCGQWGHNIRSCKNEVNPDIRRRPSGGLVFNKPTGKPRGRPRQGGSQASSTRGRGLVTAPTEGGQALRGRGGAGRGRGDGGRGMTDGGRGDGGRGRGDGGRGMTDGGRGDGGRGRTVRRGRGRGYGRGRASQPPAPPAAAAQASQPPAQ
ncbi:hypothetical protein RHSIM_Rhsim02G0197700 [Rhododendron simsii]|uniref:CCHC-type domain-containing protein n=1 Tax=Rhododendron simsii TaxID=118357 RepID=A0A834H9Y6_RHOSS|nr:hypothetical protein RHSIM_Rhsim02G0197700 [Rhododendron simsii]